MSIPKFAGIYESKDVLENISSRLGASEFTIVENPSYIYRPCDIYPMPPKILTPRTRLVAIVKDMDGTTTTTEELCVHSLEFTVGKLCGKELDKGWKGIERKADLPHIIGNSTTKHVEYLVGKYEGGIDLEAFRHAYFHAVLWNLVEGRDPGRREEVLANLQTLGIGEMLKEDSLRSFLASPSFNKKEGELLVCTLLRLYPSMPRLETFEDRVRAAIDIYYQRYHEILALIAKGKGDSLSAKILGTPSAHLIEPMPGVAIFIAALKGWLGEHLGRFGEELRDLLRLRPKCDATPDEIGKGMERLFGLGCWLERNPLRVAIVTSSIEYEARIVLKEVFKILHRQAASWDISQKKKEFILSRFSDFSMTYDGFITASDSSEIRLKPHPDLYSIALHRMGVAREDMDAVIGFEDSESGVRAIRAAGIGLCAAVPFPFTQGHDLTAAAYVLHGGLPEALLKYSLFLEHGLLK